MRRKGHSANVALRFQLPGKHPPPNIQSSTHTDIAIEFAVGRPYLTIVDSNVVYGCICKGRLRLVAVRASLAASRICLSTRFLPLSYSSLPFGHDNHLVSFDSMTDFDPTSIPLRSFGEHVLFAHTLIVSSIDGLALAPAVLIGDT
jgi:hypothetical protein